jgi:hypothetical protein
VVRVNPASINDLLALHATGAPVTLTSHAGNASLYKLVLWKCGIPECIWDITCCVADANNWPMHRLHNGEAELLLSEEKFSEIKSKACTSHRYVTAYQVARSGERLGRIHLRACEASFPNAISTCSKLLLSEIDKLREVFEFLAETRPHEVFARYITPDGVMVPTCQSGLRPHEFTNSFIHVLKELEHLLLSDEPIETKGGVCYDGTMVQLSTMLVDYWKTGRIDRYDVSGPDMIHYSTRPEYRERLTEMLTFLHKWNPKLIPRTIITRMFPGTVARVGHLRGHSSEDVITRKIDILKNGDSYPKDMRKHLRDMAASDEGLWPIEIRPKEKPYFSQHDLMCYEGDLQVHEYWKDIPLEKMRDTLVRANALLQIR